MKNNLFEASDFCVAFPGREYPDANQICFDAASRANALLIERDKVRDAELWDKWSSNLAESINSMKALWLAEFLETNEGLRSTIKQWEELKADLLEISLVSARNADRATLAQDREVALQNAMYGLKGEVEQLKVELNQTLERRDLEIASVMQRLQRSEEAASFWMQKAGQLEIDMEKTIRGRDDDAPKPKSS